MEFNNLINEMMIDNMGLETILVNAQVDTSYIIRIKEFLYAQCAYCETLENCYYFADQWNKFLLNHYNKVIE